MDLNPVLILAYLPQQEDMVLADHLIEASNVGYSKTRQVKVIIGKRCPRKEYSNSAVDIQEHSTTKGSSG